MLKLISKKKNACLALAVAATILGGGTVFAEETANYTSTITGDSDTDFAYLDVIDDNGVYKFTQDTQITHKQYGVELMNDAKIDASGKTLTLNIKDATINGAGIKIDDANTLSVKANTVKMNLTNKSGVTLNSDGLQGVRITNLNAKLTVDGNMDITADSTTNTIGIYNRGNVVVNGDVKLNIEGHEGGTDIYGASGLYATSSMKSTKGGTITVNGNVDFQGNANGIVANSGGAVVNVKGGNITINKNQTLDYAAIYAMDGVVNMNVLKDEDGNVIGADSNDVNIKGNVGLHTGAVNAADIHGTKSELNLALTTDKSSLTGVVYNQYGKNGVTAGTSNELTFTGSANLWLQNGATWNNEKWGKTDLKFKGSYVTNFTGGNDAAHTGYIVQNDDKKLTFDKYSGYTTIFYAHNTNTDLEDLDKDDPQYTEDASKLNGSESWHYYGGDTIINNAVVGSNITLVTDNANIDTANSEQVEKVLNALAGKLYYKAYVNDERNLAGTVSIADGLTASSFTKTYNSGDITFSKEDGKGSYVKSDTPVVPAKTEFTTTLTGDKTEDTEYEGNISSNGAYTFSKDSVITITNPEDQSGAIAAGSDLTIKADKNLSLKVTGSNTDSFGLVQESGKKVVIYAENLNIDVSNNKGRADAIHVYGSSDGTRGSLTINGNLNMKATHDKTAGIDGGYTLGAYANHADVVINGNVTSAIDAGSGANAYYGASHLYVSGATGVQNEGYKGGTLTVNGNVDLSGTAQGLFANIGGAVLTVNGGGKIVLDKNEAKNAGYAAIRAEDSFVNMNVKLDEAGKATGGLGNDVVIEGNVASSVGAVNSIDTNGTMTRINLALDTDKSSLHGVVINGFDRTDGTTGIDTEADEGGTESKHFTGENNLWLQNGAEWNNEMYGRLKFFADDKYKASFQGSHVTNFTGGNDAAHTGYIVQNDDNKLTFDKYSGYTTIFYAHNTNTDLEDLEEDDPHYTEDASKLDGSASWHYYGGDTIIKSAAAGSNITLVTDNANIDTANSEQVEKVLNALAGKLYYNAYVNNERNLAGTVSIADGLTASSFTKTYNSGDITFNEDGKGTYVKPEAPVIPSKTEFTTTLTGDTEADTEYAGNIQDGKYVFGANTTIKADAESAVDAKAPLTIDAGNNKLVMTAKKGSWSGVTVAFNHDAAGTTKITAGELVIGAADDFYDRSGLVVKNGNVDITAATTTVHAHSDATNPAYGILAQNNGSRVDIHGDLKLANDSFGPTHGLWAEDAKDWGGKASIINVDGKVDINLKNGNALTAIRTGSTVTVGGGNIQIANDAKNENYAMKADGGNVNVNMKANKLSAGSTTTVIKGNAIAYSEKANSNYDYPDRDSVINIGLSDKASSWTGVAFSKDLGTTGNPYKGIINLYVSNGAIWNNEAWGKTNESFAGSHVAKLTGGNSEAAAGNIFQKDSNNLTIDLYRGNTNIFYAHEGNGEAAADYAAGDTIITGAVDGSVVNLITDNTGIAMDNEESVANVLNALAGKLTYSNYTEGERNLTGYAKIADGLTASSQTLRSDTIKFNKDTGKGGTKEDGSGPDEGDIKNIFTDFISGEKQGAYSSVQQDDRSYVFTEDTTININQMTFKEKDPNWDTGFIISGAAVQNAAGVENLVIKAEDKTLKLKVALDSQTIPPDPNAGILNNRIPLRGIDNSIAGSTTTITAGTLDIDIDNTYSRVLSNGNPMIGAGSVAAIYANSTGEKAAVTVNGNTVIKAHGYGNVYGVNANGNAEIKLNGDLTMAKDGDKWALENVIDGKNTTSMGESTWRIIAGINAHGAGASVTVNGKTTIAAHGSGAIAADGATVTLGAADIEIMNNSDEKGYAYYAVGAALGTVNVGDEGKTVTLKGNAGIFGKQGQDKTFASDSKESVVNLKLTTEDSAWNGVAYKHFTDEEKANGYGGSINLTLSNGASWTNEKYGHTYGNEDWEKYRFTGSEIASFVGGASDAKAGNIFQKDSNSLTIDNYSGNTNIYYAHTGNGEAASDYAAGDTIIKSAAEGSVVSMITDNTGISMDSEDSVANVLNTLAGKLTYSKFVDGEKNLTGFVKIADGLTASSAAMKTGNIAFSTEDGKGSLKKEDVKPEPPTPPTPTYPEDQKADKFDQGISGNDEKYKEEGVQKEDGSYVFTKNPTSIEVEKGAAVSATDKDIVIDTSKAKLELKGETGIKADGADVNVKGSTDISGKVGIDAANGNVTLNGSTVISGTDAAINAGVNANVNVNTNNSALNIKGDINANGGNITIDSGKATGVINGNVTASNGGSVEISLNDKNSKLTGSYNVDGESSIVMNIANGATWELTDDEDEAAGMSLMRMAKAPAAAAKGLTINGGKTEAETGYLNMTKRTKALKIANYSGWETIIYGHENAGADVKDYKSGDTIIDKAEKGSGVILSTDNSGIDMKDKNAVEATLKALAQKVTYNDHEANGGNLTGKVQIADGLTSSSKAQNLGTLHWDENGKGQYDLDSVNWNKIIEGDYETFVMKGVRSAATTSLHTWRDNMQDTYTGADLADEDGMFAKALGGKTSSDVKGLKDSNTYYGVQVGYDKAAANGWHTGVAFDYRNGDSNYLLGGKGDNQMYSLGVYGVKSFDNDAFFRVAAKVGRVQNEYDVYNEIRSLKLHGDYKANAYGLTMEYGKTYGDEDLYFTPKAQLTWSQVGAKDYTAHTANAEMQISQDSYSSFVGRLGFEAGMKSEKGRLYAGLFAAHEFNGDISASYFANDGDRKHTSFDGEETWMEMKLGGSYDFSKNAHLYADIAKDFGANFERKWKLNAGLRFEF
ncbi:autotransporter outer membrane beta-barrel domain-containing protein [Phascolarctobacterium succinatutens]|uniref:autotransporter outer membrane beta-barrel domain-containing protein n=1 Tax=Phascolarctobacterium succinatutens TaxID=626940 RepID=UPI0025E45C53|nr:autotransporter outer membrane beta-barrel domain-containing protein [Phascolarctobacterium succinatutens]